MQFKHKETGDIIQGVLSPCKSVIHCDNNIQVNANDYSIDKMISMDDFQNSIEKPKKKKG